MAPSRRARLADSDDSDEDDEQRALLRQRRRRRRLGGAGTDGAASAAPPAGGLGWPEASVPGWLRPLLRMDLRVARAAAQLAADSRPVATVASVFSASGDEAIWFGIAGPGSLLALGRMLGLLGPRMSCAEQLCCATHPYRAEFSASGSSPRPRPAQLSSSAAPRSAASPSRPSSSRVGAHARLGRRCRASGSCLQSG